MSNIEKKRQKLLQKLKEVESEMYASLKQKTSNTAEINIGKYTSLISYLRTQLKNLK